MAGVVPLSISALRLAAETPEDGKGVRGLNLVDQLAPRLHLAVDALGQLDGLLAVGSPDDHEREGPRDVEAFRPELVGQLVRGAEALALDAPLPRRVAAAEEVFLHVARVGLVVPALVFAEPAFGDE